MRQILIAICPVCGKEFDPNTYKGRRTYCERDCRDVAKSNQAKEKYRMRKYEN